MLDLGLRLRRLLPPSWSWRQVGPAIGLKNAAVEQWRRTPLGVELLLRLHPPLAFGDVERATDVIAVAYGVARCRATSHPRRSDLVYVKLDDERSLGPCAYPSDDRQVWVPSEPGRAVPLGVDDDGRAVCLNLLGTSVLVGGSPGAGKSTAVRTLLAGLAQQRHVDLVGIDPKRVELAPWKDRFSSLVVGTETAPTMDLLRHLVDEVHRRADVLERRGELAVTIGDDCPQVTLVVDEWAELAADGTAKERAAAAALLRRYVSLGRAVGCGAILATQRPTSEVIDTGTRALLGYRLALRTGDRYQTEAILGGGHPVPADIPVSSAGSGILVGAGVPRSVQIFHLEAGRIPDVLCATLRPRNAAVALDSC